MTKPGLPATRTRYRENTPPPRTWPSSPTSREIVMSTVRESIEVAVPSRVAYERLSHFEDYPQFMSGVQQVVQLSENVAHWVMDLAGRQTEFDARITERRPGELLAWQAIDGPRLAEKVIFQQLSADRCRIIAEIDVDARLVMPDDPDLEDSLDRQLRADMSNLKEFVETGRPAGIFPGPGGFADGAGQVTPLARLAGADDAAMYRADAVDAMGPTGAIGGMRGPGRTPGDYDYDDDF